MLRKLTEWKEPPAQIAGFAHVDWQAGQTAGAQQTEAAE
jgi:hypothetical protein